MRHARGNDRCLDKAKVTDVRAVLSRRLAEGGFRACFSGPSGPCYGDLFPLTECSNYGLSVLP